MGTTIETSLNWYIPRRFNMKLALVLGCLSVALAEPEAWHYGFYQHHPAVYTHGLAHTYHQAPYVPLVYTYPHVQYAQPKGYTAQSNQYPDKPKVADARNTKKSIPYGCTVDHKVKYDIEKVEYFDEKCETKYKTECYEVTRTVDYTEEVCNDKYVQSCAEKWEVIDGAKVWVPDTSRCQNLKKTECYDETRQRYEPEEKCDQVPYQDCQKIHGQRPQQVVCAEVSLNCKGKGKTVLTEFDLEQYGIQVSKP